MKVHEACHGKGKRNEKESKTKRGSEDGRRDASMKPYQLSFSRGPQMGGRY